MTLLCDSDAFARPTAAPLPTLDTDDWSRRLIAPEPETLPATRVLFAGGGTGGHLYPAVAVARALQQLAPGSEALFVGSARPLERKILAGAEQEHRALPTAPWRGLRGAPRFAWEQARGLAASWRLLGEWRPDVVVGLGGFPSLGPALAARLRGVPLALFEPNASAGKANRLLSRLAREAYVHFAETELACMRVDTGTPVDERSLPGRALTQAAARAALGLPAERPVLLLMGGSQGSRAINGWVEQALAAGAGSPALSYLHLAGSDEARDRLARAYTAAGLRARVETFLPGIGIAYRAASLALVRGGGATLAELLAAGVPGVCVPMPGSADDHQRKNADAFVAMGGVRWLEEQTLTTDHFRELVDLAQSPWQIEQHAQRARSAGRPNAAAVVARRLVHLSNPQHPAA